MTSIKPTYSEIFREDMEFNHPQFLQNQSQNSTNTVLGSFLIGLILISLVSLGFLTYRIHPIILDHLYTPYILANEESKDLEENLNTERVKLTKIEPNNESGNPKTSRQLKVNSNHSGFSNRNSQNNFTPIKSGVVMLEEKTDDNYNKSSLSVFSKSAATNNTNTNTNREESQNVDDQNSPIPSQSKNSQSFSSSFNPQVKPYNPNLDHSQTITLKPNLIGRINLDFPEYRIDSELPEFVEYNPQNPKLIILRPSQTDIGEHSIVLRIFDEKENYLLTYFVEVSQELTNSSQETESQEDNSINQSNQDQLQNGLEYVDFEQLSLEVENILGTEINQYSVYVHDLKRDRKFQINGHRDRYPASISKLPIAMLTLHSIDQNEFGLYDLFPIKPMHKYIPEDPMYNYPDHEYYTIREYVYNLIVSSDNTALRHLRELHGGNEIMNQKVLDRLGLDKFSVSPHVTNVENVARVFEDLYYQKTLSPEMNAWFLELLMTDTKWNSDRLDLAFRKYDGVQVAHKIGQVTTSNGITYHDAGIVFGSKTDFVIVILNEDTNASAAIDKIIRISQLVYNNLNK